MLYDVIVIGGGPAGVAAVVYCARKKLKTLMIADSFGGQSIVSDEIQNWIGEVKISGSELAKKLEAHARAFPEEVEIKQERVNSVKSIRCSEPGRICDFEITTDKGNTFESKSVILASGARRRTLNVPGEEKYAGRGVAYCSTCDAPLFRNKTVAVVGGGNAGAEAVIDLLAYASKIYLLHRGSALKADPVSIEKIQKNEKVTIILNAQTQEIVGETIVAGLKYLNSQSNEVKQLDLNGVFVEVGSVPNSEMVKDVVEIDQWGQVMVDFKHASTSHPGIFAAGDVTNDPYKQNNISVGDAVKAALATYAYLQQREKMPPAVA